MTGKLFSVPSFRFTVGDLASAVGKWSRGATFGKKVQNGVEIDFSPETLSQMVKNAAARGDKIAICQDHKSAFVATTGQPAPSLGYFYALAVFDSGRLVEHWARDGGSPPAGIDDEGHPRDGLYCRLGEITSLGADPKEGLGCYAGLSPMFSDQQADETGAPIGYALIDFGATSTPFQSGCALQLHHQAAVPPRTRRYGMDPEMMKKLGLAEGASPEECMAAAMKYVGDMEMEKAEMAKKMAEMMPPEKKDEDEEKAMAALAVKLGLAPNASRKEIALAAQAGAVPLSQIPALVDARVKAALDADRQQREADAAKQRADQLAVDAVANGYPAADKDALHAFALANFGAAQKLAAQYLEKAEQLARRFTHAGGLAGASRGGAGAVPSVVEKDGVVRFGLDLSAATKALMAKDPKLRFEDACAQAARDQPHLLTNYFGPRQ